MFYQIIYLILIIILIGSVIYFKCIRKEGKIEKFEDRYKIPNEIYDKQYVDMYDLVWIDNKRNEDIVKFIDENLLKKYDKEDINILDCGCGIGYINNLFNVLGYK